MEYFFGVLALVLVALLIHETHQRGAVEAEKAAIWRDLVTKDKILEETRSEVRRLTDVIIHMKDQGKVLPPETTDERWGSYVIDNDLELEEERRRERAAAAARDRDADDELRKMLADF